MKTLLNRDRKSGIDAVGNITWGTHLCQFYQTKDDLIDILVPYFKAGLENNEFCMWVTSEPLGVKEAKASLGKAVRDLDGYIAKGQLKILDYSQWYTKSGNFDADEVLQGWVEKENQALERGFDGLRLTGNTFWLNPEDWKSFYDYEATVNSVIGSHRMIAICTYSLDKCGASEILDVISNHEFALIRRAGLWTMIENAKQKRIGQSLKDSEVRYRRLFEAAQDGILILDAETGQINDANPFLADMLGYTKQEITGKKLWEIGTFTDETISQEAFLKLQSEGYVRYEDLPLQSKTGNAIDVEFVSNVYVVDSERVIQCNIRDITARKKAEAEQRESESKFMVIFNNMTDGMVIVNPDTRKFTMTNDAFCHMLGYSQEEIQNLGVSDIHPEEDLPSVIQGFEKQLRGEIDVTPNTPVKRKDGSIFYADINAQGVLIGNKTYVVGNFRDITERKQDEANLRESERDLHNLIMSNIDGMIIVNKEGVINFVNPAAESIFGHKSSELVGSMFGFTLVEDKSTELEVNRPDRERLVIEVRMGKTDWKGEIMNLLSLRDITERKKMQEELIVSDRLASIGELVAGVAHEVNNPLTGVIGFSDLLLGRKDLPDDIKEDLNTISSEAKRAALIVRNLLTFARKAPAESEAVNIHKLIENTLSLRTHQHRLNNIEVNTKFASDLPEVIINSSKLQQVFMNIIINAEFFMIEAHKKGALTIATEWAGPIVKVSFADDGPGISPGNLSHLFDAFFTTKEIGKGTGLGLSICYGIISEAGGSIYAESQLGKGTTFVVELPAATFGVEL
ncbi:PAS domain S-box protein [Chloroflexota bacterium]